MTEIEQLAAQIAELTKPIPLNVALWTPERVGEFLSVTPRTVIERYSKHPGFPAPIVLPSKGDKGRMRWKAMQVIRWADSLQN